jgi:iterative type I PKS product template protein
MAMTVCDYAYKLIRPHEKNAIMNVSHMQVPKPLIASPEGKTQMLRLTAKLDASKLRADLVFSSGEGTERVEHAHCQVLVEDGDKCLSDWARHAYLIQSRIEWLKDAETQGKAHKIGRGLAYKLFAALVDYDKRYRGMEEVILHSEYMEATASVVFQTSSKDGN